MAGKKPNYRVVAKSKSSGKYQDIAAFWIGEKGISGLLDKGIAKIVLTSGAVITAETCWFNLQENKDTEQSGDSSSEQAQQAPQDSDELPF